MVEHDDGHSTAQKAQQGSRVQHHEHKVPSALGYVQYLLQALLHMATGAEVFMLLAPPCRMAGADLTWVW